MQGIAVQTPEMPNAYNPDYETWKTVFDQFAVDLETVLVAHSCGAGFLLRWLGETRRAVAKLILVAPWLDPSRKRGMFLDFAIDQSIERKLKEMDIVFSSNDGVEGVQESIEILSTTFSKANLHDLKNRGHFTLEEMQTIEFPELLKLFDAGP